MALTAAQVVVSLTAIPLNPVDTGASGVQLQLRNTHATDAVMLGPVGVTAGNGYPLPALQNMVVDLRAGEILYAIRGAAADVTVGVLRVGD